MKKKTRLFILFSCVAAFLVISPILVAYSMGYRFDFENNQIVATGGIYVRTFPSADEVVIDSKISAKPGMFSNSIFAQSLLPKEHTVYIQKDGYYDYYKTLPVTENEVTKLEDVVLIKKDIAFSDVSSKINYFSVAPNNQNIITVSDTKTPSITYFSLNDANSQLTFPLPQAGKVSDIKWSNDSNVALIRLDALNNAIYYSFDTRSKNQKAIRLSYLDKNSKQINFNPQDSQELFYVENQVLYSLKNNEFNSVLYNVLTYHLSGNGVTWLSVKGLLYESDISGKTTNAITTASAPLNSNEYQIISLAGKTFLKEDLPLFLLNSDNKTFENFNSPKANYKILPSPDQKNLIYWGENKIYVHSFAKDVYQELFSGEKISNIFWLNNDYIIFAAGNKVIISEIDYRGNINTITLPQSFKSPQIYFSRQNNKLYVLSQNDLMVSEKLIP
jgi:hypothetical protein